MEALLGLFFWAILGLAGSASYRGKGRSGIVGFLGGIVLGPFGLLLALASSSTLKKCPHCSERVKKEAIVCRYCGRDIARA